MASGAHRLGGDPPVPSRRTATPRRFRGPGEIRQAFNLPATRRRPDQAPAPPPATLPGHLQRGRPYGGQAPAGPAPASAAVQKSRSGAAPMTGPNDQTAVHNGGIASASRVQSGL